ncbi:putative E3 SUMO-protein ligase RNF212 [Microcaecilia unicolor]|uniref:Probable E3 SUMO-protein ligase RNF212 n=1 Tax=Microcaecilia unicolor TaxID=1415580 RepID=A0A6P7X0P1_9AMPH|nr:probable E3 SUMO-protein ligase RNF212 [Microcaecilia unicolor]
MAASVFCNLCFQQPRREMARFALTNCGHVLCERCLQKGKKDTCTVCGALCRTVFLSKQMNPDLQALFMDVAELCKKYSKEFSQISEFQENHKRHLLTFYKGQISKLEETLKKVTDQMQGQRGEPVSGDRHFKASCKSMRPPQQSSRLPAANTSRNSVSAYQSKQMGCSSCTLPQARTSSSERVEFMETDPVSSQMKNSETVGGPNRLSLISPPQDGRMGSVPYRSLHLSGQLGSQNRLPGSERSAPMRIPVQTNVPLLFSPDVAQNSNARTWDTSGPRVSQLSQQTSPLRLPCPKHQISIPNLLWKQNFGSTTSRGMST